MAAKHFISQLVLAWCLLLFSTVLTHAKTSAIPTCYPPVITTEPVNATICAGVDTSFSIIATGDGLNYQWQENQGSGFVNLSDGGVYSGSATATLTFTAVPSSMDGYQYQCIVTGTCSPTDTSTVAILTVKIPLSITEQPTNDTLCVSAYFDISASGFELNATNYTWQVNSGSGFVDVNDENEDEIYEVSSSQDNSSLYIYPVADSMGGYQYRCIVSGECSPNDTSYAATLITTIPHIIAEPDNTTVCASSTTSIGVIVGPTSGVAYQWQVNPGSGFTNISNGGVYSGATSDTLILTSVPESMNGYQYQCVLTGVCSPSSNTVTLTVDTPSITAQPTNDTLCSSSTAYFDVYASGFDLNATNFTWQVNTGSGFVDINDEDEIYEISFNNSPDNSSLSIYPVVDSMEGYQYRCIVSSECSPIDTSDVATLIMAPGITQQPVNAIVCASSNTSFSVTLYPTSGVTCQWQVNPGSGFTNISNGGVYSGATSDTLKLTSVSDSMNGDQYQCVLTGACSPSSDSVTLTVVNTAPAITGQPINDTLCVPGTAFFLVYASGLDLSLDSYNWQVNTGSGFVDINEDEIYDISFGFFPDNSMLSVYPVIDSMDGYQYRCIITGLCSLSDTSDVVTLTMRLPVILTQPVNITACDSSNALFSVSAIGTAYQWQENRGSGFSDISDGGVYSGSETDSLTLTGVTRSMNGYQYKCVVRAATCLNNAVSDSATLAVNTLPTVTAAASSSTICYNSSSTLTAGGAVTYTWSPATGLSNTTGSSITATLTTTTTYTVSGTDANGCVNTATETITVNPLPTVTASASPSSICYNSSSTLTTGGEAVTYTWSPSTGLSTTTGSSVTTTLTATTTYTVTGTNANGCVNTATEIITVNPLPTITASASPSLICYNSGSTLTAGGGATYTWSPIIGLSSTTGSSATATLTANTTYTVTGTDVNGCVNTAVTSVNVTPQLIANAGYTRMGSTSNDTLGGSPAASGGTTPYSYLWETGNDSVISTISNPVASVSQSTMYYLAVSDSLGCTAYDTVTILLTPTFTAIDTNSITVQYADPAQFMALSDTSYNTIVKIDEAYFKYHPDTNENGLQSNYNLWKYFWQGRLHPNSNGNPSFNYAEQQIYNYYTNQSCVTNGSSGNWKCIGPLNEKGNIGRVVSIWVDPSDTNHILLGSNTGSIWRTTDHGMDWVCITDGSGLPSLGINDIAVDPENTNIIYIATGFSLQMGNQYSLGVCYTTNGNDPADSVMWHVDNNFYQNVLHLNSSTPSQNQIVAEVKFQPGTQNVFATVTGVPSSGSTVSGILWKKNASNSSNSWTSLTLPLPSLSGTYYPQYWSLNDIEFDSSNSQTMFVGGDEGGFCYGGGVPTWVSQDSGSTWNIVDLPDFDVLRPQDLTNNSALTTGEYFPTIPNPCPVADSVDWYNQTGSTNWKLEKKDGTNYTADVLPNSSPDYLIRNTPWAVTAGQHCYLQFDAHVPAGTKLVFYLTNTMPYCSTCSNNFNVPIDSIDETNSANDYTDSGKYLVYFNDFQNWFWCYGLVFKAIANTSNSHYSTTDTLWFGNVKFLPESQNFSRISFATTSKTDHVDILYNTFYSYNFSVEEFDVNNTNKTITPVHGQEADLGSNSILGTYAWTPTSFDVTYSVTPDDSIPTKKFYFGYWQLAKSTNGELTSLGGGGFTENSKGSNTHVDVRRIYRYWDNSSQKYFYYLGTDGNILKYDPSLNSFNSHNGNGLALNQFIGLSTNGLLGDYVAGGTIDNSMYIYNGSSWTESSDGDCWNTSISPSFVQTDSLQIVGNESGGGSTAGLEKSNNNGRTWGGGISQLPVAGYLTSPIHFHPATGVLYAASDRLYDYSSTNHWHDVSNDFSNEPNLTGILFNNQSPAPQIQEFNVNYSDTNVIYVAYEYAPYDTPNITNEQLFVIDGHDTTVNAIHIPTGIISNLEYITDVISDPINPDRIWVSFNGFYGSTPIKNKVIYFDVNPATGGINDDTDISAGLPDFPINKLVYQMGSNDIIYAATDVGVYYWNKTNKSWYCYSNNLPPALFTSIDINYCSGNVVASTYGRGIWESPVILTHQFATNPIPISSSTNSWTTSRQVYSDVIVPHGQTLTISGKNTIIDLENDAAIIVDTGAKLIVDSATLTNGCGEMWAGIQVLGNPTEDQSTSSGMPNHQGMVVTYNGATIENAYVGILVDGAYYSSPDYTYPNGLGTEGGGIVQVNNTKFLNVRSAIIFDSYHSPVTYGPGFEYPNQSEIEMDSFICNRYLYTPYDSVGTSVFISMWDVHGVQILGNTFRGDSALTVTQQGIGINGYDADFWLREICKTDEFPCTNFAYNNFNNLYYGIRSVVGNPWNIVRSTLINNNKFNHTDRCIYLSGYQNNPAIDGNNMTLNAIGDTTYGVYLSACNGYNVEADTITGISPDSLNYGMIINNSEYDAVTDTNDFVINNNSFTDLQYGSVGFGDNASGIKFCNEPNGLEFLCNQYSNVKYAIAGFSNDISSVYDGIMKSSQGSPSNPANNTFDTANAIYDLYFNFDDVFVDYYFTSPKGDVYDPGTKITGFNVESTSTANSCTISLGSGSLTSQIESEKSIIADSSSAKRTLSSKIDGGNQSGLLYLVSDYEETSSYWLRYYLLAAGPYLSDTVLNAAIDRSMPMTDSDIVAVTLNNAPLDSAVYHNLLHTFFTGELTEAQSELESLVEAAQNGISQRDTLNADIHEITAQRCYAIQNLSDLYTSAVDSGIMTIDSIINLYVGYNMPIHALSYIAHEGDTASARALIDTMPSTDSVQSSLKNYYKLQLAIKENDSTAYALNSSQLTQVNSIASQQTYAGFMALNLLSIINGQRYHEQFPVLIGEGGGTEVDRMAIKGQNSDTVASSSLSVAPNPAKNEVTLSFGNLTGKPGLLTIYNEIGNVIYQLNSEAISNSLEINTSNWSQGVYEIRFIVSNGNTYKSKLAVINR